jgi:hypothetical protein
MTTEHERDGECFLPWNRRCLSPRAAQAGGGGGMIVYCEKCQQRFDTDLHEECPRCADRPKPEIPAMPKWKPWDLMHNVQELESWGRDGWDKLQREAALANALAEALEGLLKPHSEGDIVCEMARTTLARYKEARNG